MNHQPSSFCQYLFPLSILKPSFKQGFQLALHFCHVWLRLSSQRHCQPSQHKACSTLTQAPCGATRPEQISHKAGDDGYSTFALRLFPSRPETERTRSSCRAARQPEPLHNRDRAAAPPRYLPRPLLCQPEHGGHPEHGGRAVAPCRHQDSQMVAALRGAGRGQCAALLHYRKNTYRCAPSAAVGSREVVRVLRSPLVWLF